MSHDRAAFNSKVGAVVKPFVSRPRGPPRSGARADTPDETRILNRASIVFDIQPAIMTNEVSNVILSNPAATLLAYALGTYTPREEIKAALDFNGDGAVDVSDLIFLTAQ